MEVQIEYILVYEDYFYRLLFEVFREVLVSSGNLWKPYFYLEK